MKKHIIIATLLIFAFHMPAQNTFTTVEQPEWTKNAVIYQINTRQFSESGKLTEVTKQLGRIRALGVDIIWLMPVQPIGKVNRKGELGSYYSISDYTAVNEEFGTLADFQALVERAHELGLVVILDWVANHTAWDHHWVTEHLDFYTADAKGKRPIVTLDEKGVPTDWDDTADLDYDNHALRREMIDAMKFWVEKTKLDGFRCDVAGFIPTDFWIDARAELTKIKPMFMLAEWDSPEIHRAFNMTYGWPFKNLMIEIEQGKKTLKDIAVYRNETAKRFNPNDLIMYFTTNHDLNSWDGTEYELFGRNADNNAILTYCMGGMPLIYNGQESVLDKRLEFFRHDPIVWGKYERSDFYRNLNKLYHENAAFWNGSCRAKFELISDAGQLYAFRLKAKDNSAVVFQNYGDKALAISEQQLPKRKLDRLSNKTIKPSKTGEYILPAHSSWIFTE